MVKFNQQVWDSLKWAQRNGYCYGREAIQEYAKSCGGTAKAVGMGVYADSYEFVPADNVYTLNGYKNRAHYLRSLADDHGHSIQDVTALAEILGPDEDFDALVVALEDSN